MNWFDIWNRKGLEDTDDLVRLDGFEKTTIRPEVVIAEISKCLNLTDQDKILEIGCGAGLLAERLKGRYFGVDYSHSMLSKFKRRFSQPVAVAEASALPFAGKSFDKVIVFSVFQYFPTEQYVQAALKEIRRVARKSMFVGDLPYRSESKGHLLFRKEQFEGWNLTPGYYNSERFNAFSKVGPEK